MCATVRLRKNKIRVLEVNGSPIHSHSDKEKVLHDFYHNLLGVPSSITPINHLSTLLAPTALDSFRSSSLITEFSLAEIRNALQSMRNDSSPGPDGFGPAFFKYFWDLSGPCLKDLLEEFYNNTADL